jgi:hypothetical protein
MKKPDDHRQGAPLEPTPAPKVPLLQRGAALGSVLALGASLGACGDDTVVAPMAPPRDSGADTIVAPMVPPADSGADTIVAPMVPPEDSGVIDTGAGDTGAGDGGAGDSGPPPPMPPPVDAG